MNRCLVLNANYEYLAVLDRWIDALALVLAEKADPLAHYDQVVRSAGITGGFEKVPPLSEEAWMFLPGWKLLYGDNDREARLAKASLSNRMQRLPAMLSGLI